MQRLIAHRYEHTIVQDGTDRVLFGLTLPSESRINNIKATVSIKTLDSVLAESVGMYELAGYILPLPDVDAAPQYENLWDQLVPKQEDDDTIEMDSGSADTNPAFEPGEESLEELFSVGFQPEQIYKRRGIVSQDSPFSTAFFSTTSQFLFHERVKVNVSKNYFIEQPSVLVFGLSAPTFAHQKDKAAAPLTALTGVQIAQLKYMTGVLERAFYDTLGLTEAGAETPFEEATALLKIHLEPLVTTDGTNENIWSNEDYTVHVIAMIDHSVPGNFDMGTVSAAQ